MTYRRKYFATTLRAREEHIQSTLPALGRHRPKALRHVSIGVSCVANRDVDHIAFIALNILKVLHKERLGLRSIKELLKLGVSRTQQLQFRQNSVSLGHRERGDS